MALFESFGEISRVDGTLIARAPAAFVADDPDPALTSVSRMTYGANEHLRADIPSERDQLPPDMEGIEPATLVRMLEGLDAPGFALQ